MSFDSSVTQDAPAPATEPLADPSDTVIVASLPAPELEEDGSTTPGGPTMILVFTGVFVTISWLRRRRRKRRELH